MVTRPKSFFQKLVSNGELKFNRKLGIYLICLVFSAGMWLLITLSHTYETDIVFPVDYIGIPKNRVVTNHLPETITAKVSAGGFSLLWYKIKGRGDKLTLEINPSKLRENKGVYYTLPNYRLDKISAQLGEKIKIQKISPDTIFVSYSEKMTRKLTVRPNINITLQKQYVFSDSIKSEPSVVTVSGPKHLVEKMNFAETEKIVLKDVSDRKDINLAFRKPEHIEGLVFSPETVRVIIPVEKLTEGSKDVHVSVRNLPKGNKLKVYPEKVKVTYLVGLSKYDKTDASMFDIGFNYKSIQKGKNNKIKLEIYNTPSFVTSVKVEPASVEYIIQK